MDTCEGAEQLRPFNFVLVVWGKRYRDYFLEYCLPSLLAPGNIPSLGGRRRARYLIATTVEDWSVMQQAAVFRELERHAAAIFLQLPPCPSERPYWMQNVIGHKLCCEKIFADKGYRIFTSPDAVFSEGTVLRMHDLAAKGVEVILKLTAPSVEEPQFFKTLAEMQLLPSAAARRSGTPIVLSGRQMAFAALRSMHHMSVVNEWQAPYFCGYATTPWWRVGEEGAVVCGLLPWDILLLDYAAVKSHDTTLLNDRGWDGDYIMRTIGDLETIYLVRDSDEINAVSWSSNPTSPLRRRRGGELRKGADFRKLYYHPSFNLLHRRLLFFPTHMHGGPLSASWDVVEQQALRTLLTWVDPPSDLGNLSRRLSPNLNNYNGIDVRIAECQLPWWHRNTLMWIACRHCLMPIIAYLERVGSLLHLVASRFAKLQLFIKFVGLGLVGDKTAIQWWYWHFRKFSAKLRRADFDEPRPELPG
jgi:hypothetical protein